MARRPVLLALAGLALAYAGYGASILSRRAPRPPPPPGEIRGAYHVHTSHSDGRGTLDEVARAAREAGLSFVVVTDHNVMSPEEQGYRDGVLVVQGSEVSAPYGHVVALGTSRALDREERRKDTLGTIRLLGGRAALAHPFHPRRPFTRWDRADFAAFEAISNDSFWGGVVHRRAYGRVALALLDFPWDPPRSTLDFFRYPAEELARYDALARAADGRPPPALLCAADAHGWPSYRAAFEAFSMHLPMALSGDARADAPAVLDRLLDGSSTCVFDGVAPAAGVRLALGPSGDRIDVSVVTEEPSRASFRLLRDGAAFGAFASSPGGGSFSCGGPCPRPARYRLEATWGGRPWIFTNPVRIE